MPNIPEMEAQLTEYLKKYRTLKSQFSSFDSEYFGIYEIDKKGNLSANKDQLEVWEK